RRDKNKADRGALARTGVRPLRDHFLFADLRYCVAVIERHGDAAQHCDHLLQGKQLPWHRPSLARDEILVHLGPGLVTTGTEAFGCLGYAPLSEVGHQLVATGRSITVISALDYWRGSTVGRTPDLS